MVGPWWMHMIKDENNINLCPVEMISYSSDLSRIKAHNILLDFSLLYFIHFINVAHLLLAKLFIYE